MMIWLQDMDRMWWTVAAIRMLLCHIIPMSTPRPISRILIKRLVLNFQTYPAQVVSKIFIMLCIANDKYEIVCNIILYFLLFDSYKSYILFRIIFVYIITPYFY